MSYSYQQKTILVKILKHNINIFDLILVFTFLKLDFIRFLTLFSWNLALKKLLLSYDKDGEITKDDIESFLNELGSFPTDEEIQEKIDAVDSDGNFNVYYWLKLRN